MDDSVPNTRFLFSTPQVQSYGVIFANALTHLGAFLRSGYNPGVLTALILFLPASFWVAKVCFGKGGLPYGVLAFIVADGVFLHAVLMASTELFLHGVIGRAALTGIQIVNAISFFVFAWIADSWRIGNFVRPRQSSQMLISTFGNCRR